MMLKILAALFPQVEVLIYERDELLRRRDATRSMLIALPKTNATPIEMYQWQNAMLEQLERPMPFPPSQLKSFLKQQNAH